MTITFLFISSKNTSMPKEYYLISDLHIGGDEALGVCDFEDELIQFLRDLQTQSKNAELIIIGDAFGLWEFTQVVGKEGDSLNKYSNVPKEI